jgi:cold shock CspA family protein/ribosome-associated translation inhibitor RaiA
MCRAFRRRRRARGIASRTCDRIDGLARSTNAGRPSLQIPLQLTFKEIAHSDAVEALVRAHAAKLETFHPRITACRVVLDAAHRHRHKGRDYHVRIDITVPGAELVVGRDPPASTVHEDLNAAIDHAFDVAERLLDDHARRRRGDVKTHEPTTTGRVRQLLNDRGYGFIETPDGREIYFHRRSVPDGGFDRFAVGTEVRFVEEQGEKGPQASTVVALGR